MTTSVFSFFAGKLLYFKVGSQNDGEKVPVDPFYAIPYWIIQGYIEDLTLFAPLLVTIPTVLWSFLASLDMIILMLRKKTRAELLYHPKQKKE